MNLHHCMFKVTCGNFGAVYSVWDVSPAKCREIAKRRMTAYVRRNGFEPKRIRVNGINDMPSYRGVRGGTAAHTIRTWR